MKFYVKDQIVESDKALNIGEVFCKLGLDPSVIGGLVDGQLHDFYFYPSDGAQIDPIFSDSKVGLNLIRHSTCLLYTSPSPRD